jgi:membrane protein
MRRLEPGMHHHAEATMKVWHPKALRQLAMRAVKGWVADKATSMGAALAFYSLLSLAPLLVVVIAITGLFLGRDQAEQLLFSQVNQLVGDTGAEGIRTILNSVDTEREGIIATVVGGLTLLLGATTVFAELKTDLDRIWKHAATKASGAWGFLRTRLLSFGMVMAIAFLLLVSLVVSAAVSAAGKAWFGRFEAVLHVLEFGLSVAVMTVLFGMMYKLLPAAKIRWRDVWVGAAVTSLLFWVGKFAIGLYLGKSDVVSGFGSAGTLVLVILWVYYSAQIFFLGAEFTHEYAKAVGSRSGGKPDAAVSPAANSDFVREEALVRRAERIVKGSDPVVLKRRGS